MTAMRQSALGASSAGGPQRASQDAREPIQGVELALLGLLRARPMHAYEMAQQLARGEALGRVWRLKQSHLYALLNKLEAAGYLEGTTEPQGSRPPRRMLHLTPAGEEAFAAWVGAPVRHGRDFRLEFLAKLFFAEHAGPASVTQLIARQRAECERWLSQLLAQSALLGPAQRFDRLVLDFRLSQIEAIVSWLDTCAGESSRSPTTSQG
jgi:PadR family transcriptional regulator, regulatory protein AphA